MKNYAEIFPRNLFNHKYHSIIMERKTGLQKLWPSSSSGSAVTTKSPQILENTVKKDWGTQKRMPLLHTFL